jgi:2-hydroxychromene-2-carboxylate isomerase
MVTIEYFLSLSSPFTYLGHPTLIEVARRNGARILYRPADFRRILKQTGGQLLPDRHPARQASRMLELERWSRRRNLPIVLHPKYHFTARELPSGLLIAAQEEGHECDQLAFAMLRACWAEDQDIADPGTLRSILKMIGLDVGLVERALLTGPQAIYEEYTSDAIRRGIFGAPTYIVRGEMFWGQDRLDFVEEVLAEG